MGKPLRLQFFLATVLVLSVACFFIFFRLDVNPLYLWDESRLAVNAFEMCQTGHWFVTTFDYYPDMWNVKPPLMIILQAISMKLLGYNELAVRLPAAIAALVTVILLFAFATRQLNSLLTGICSVLFLCTSGGYICIHVARTGDYDTLLIFFLTAYFLSAFTFLNTGKYRYYILFCLLLFLAMFTKGIAGVFFLPGTVLMLFLHLKRESFRLKYFLPMLASFVAIGCYYLLRESYTRGYIHIVIYEEIWGRMFSENFNTGSPWYHFFQRLVTVHFNPWWILALLSLPAYFICSSKEKKLIQGIWITLFIFWIPITISINKNDWYSAPSFPLLSLLAAITFSRAAAYFIKNVAYKNVAIGGVLLLITWTPFNNMIDNVYALSDTFGFEELIKTNQIPANTKIISNRYDPSLNFYQKILAVKGLKVQLQKPDDVQPGETIITLNNSEALGIQQKFKCTVVYSFRETQMILVENQRK